MVASLLFVLLVPGAAHAAGSPDISLSQNAPSQVLFGTEATVSLTAANPAGQPYGYNLSFRDVLPPGISYVPGSGTGAGDGVEPQVLRQPARRGSDHADLAQPQ